MENGWKPGMLGSGYWRFMELTFGVPLNIQHQGSSIVPVKSNALFLFHSGLKQRPIQRME